jgi:hypothetical protein
MIDSVDFSAYIALQRRGETALYDGYRGAYLTIEGPV